MKSAAAAGRTSRSRRIPLLIEGAVVLMCVLCILIALTYSNFRNLEEASRLNIHTYEVLGKIGVLRASLNEEELRLRGFALTGDAAFLSDLERIENEGLSALTALDSLTRDRPSQQQRLRVFTGEYADFHSTRFLRKPGSPTTPKGVAQQTLPRRAEMERLKATLADIEKTERGLLLERLEMHADSQRKAAMFLLGASFCAVTFTLVVLVLLGLQVHAAEKSNAHLVTSQQQLQSVLDHAPIILYSVDPSERFTLMTGKGAASIGMTPETVVGKALTEVIGESYDFEPVRAALRGGTNVSRAAIKGRVFETNRIPIDGGAGHISGMIGVGFDVTDRVKAEDALRDSENRFRSVIESLQEVVFQLDADGCWSFLNPAWRLALGHEVGWSLGRSVLEFVVPGDREEFESLLRTPGLEPRFARRSLIRFSTRSGQARWMDVQVQIERDQDGNLAGGAGTLTDITDRKLAQEELLATTTLQKAILNSSSYSIIAINAHGVIESFNRAAQELLGYEADSVRGRETPLLFHDPLEIERRARELSAELGHTVPPDAHVLVAKARNGAIDEREWTYVAHDGRRISMRLSTSELRGVEGEIRGFVMIGYDLTDSRRAESLKNEFVSVVSHELRTPLTSIRGALGLLAGGVAGQLPDSARQMIEIARKNSERLVLLINDILDIEKIESGEMRFEARELNLGDLLESAVEQNLAYGEGLGVKVVLEGASVDKNLQISGDEGRLQQVMANLISNACKFTPTGGTVRIQASTHGSFAQVSVIDEGPGVPEEFVPRLFDKFAQADSSSTRKQGGTGLGLAIARAIVERQGGTLRYIAAPPGAVGATFTFELPLTNAAEILSTAPVRKVLICEDEPEFAELLALIVSKGGYQPEVAASLADARAKLEESEYFGLTLDILFPDGDGLDLLTEIRANPRTRELPVVVVSLNSREGVLRGEAFDVVEWMRKPIDAARLLATLHRFERSDSPRVLHVEDDGDIRQVMAAILGESALMTPASTLREARARLADAEREGLPFDLAILDIGLPDGSGLELIHTLSSYNPPVPVIMFSASEASLEEARLVTASLVKSRTSNEVLRDTIQRMLRGHESNAAG